MSIIKEEQPTINESIEKIPAPPKKLTAFSKFMNKHDGGDFTLIGGKPVGVGMPQNIMPSSDLKTTSKPFTNDLRKPKDSPHSAKNKKKNS